MFRAIPSEGWNNPTGLKLAKSHIEQLGGTAQILDKEKVLLVTLPEAPEEPEEAAQDESDQPQPPRPLTVRDLLEQQYGWTLEEERKA